MNIYPTKKCTCCGVSKEISLFNKNRKAKDGLRYNCKDCQKADYQANKEKRKAQSKARYQANPEKVKARVKAYNKARREAHKDDPCFIVMESQSCRIPIALNGIEMAAPAKELVGGWDGMATHLESQFVHGMTWENHGSWHIDHIKPCASFDFNDPKQQRECFHYTNTQPLWASENRSKGSKV